MPEHEHVSWRERLEAIGMPDEPVFDDSDDPTLTAFGTLFDESELVEFAANKHLRTGALSPIYDCETQSRRTADAEPEQFAVAWAPVWSHTDPLTGFRTGGDSSVYGTAPTVAMPPDERTAALLLLVTSTFVHLSARRVDTGRLVQGAVETDDGSYRFLNLVPSDVAAPAADPTSLSPAAGG